MSILTTGSLFQTRCASNPVDHRSSLTSTNRVTQNQVKYPKLVVLMESQVAFSKNLTRKIVNGVWEEVNGIEEAERTTDQWAELMTVRNMTVHRRNPLIGPSTRHRLIVVAHRFSARTLTILYHTERERMRGPFQLRQVRR